MAGLHIFLFGKLKLSFENQDILGLEARKAQELFCFLLLNPHRSHFRETMADLLWGDAPATQPKTYLRKAIWQLQTVLDAHVTVTRVPLLLAETDWVQLNDKADYWLDAQVFKEIFTLVQNIPGRHVGAMQAKQMEQAIKMYRGDLLEGWYSDWCLYERERYKYMYLAMLDKLIAYHEVKQNYEQGISYGVEVLRHDPARERTHRRLMRLHYLAGRRTESLHQFERCASILDRELQVKPSKRTQFLFETIRNDHLETIRNDHLSNVASSISQANAPAPPFLFDLFDRLQQLQVTIRTLQYQIQQDIQTVKNFINDQ